MKIKDIDFAQEIIRYYIHTFQEIIERIENYNLNFQNQDSEYVYLKNLLVEIESLANDALEMPYIRKLSDLLLYFVRTIGGKESIYGMDYEDDIFMMHHFCWCERDECPWCAGCTCEDEGKEWGNCDFCKGEGIFKEKGGEPGRGAPNFWHKPTGFKVWWYKYIGRDMETNMPITKELLMKIYKDVQKLKLNSSVKKEVK